MSEATANVTAPSPEAKAKLYAALAKLQAGIPKVAKGSTADTGTYKYQYAGLDAVTDAAMPALGKHGLAFITLPTLNDEGKFVLVYLLTHEAGGEISGEYPLLDKGSPQQIGSAITYARRYALCAATGIAPGGDDDDAQAANQVHDYSGSRRQQWQDRRPVNQGPRQERPAASRPAASREQAAGAPRQGAPQCPEGMLVDDVLFRCVKPGGHWRRPEDLLCRDETGLEWAAPNVPASSAPLDPADPWQIAIDGAASAEDTAKLREELAGTYPHDDPRAAPIIAAIEAREASLKPAGGERESTFARAVRARIANAGETDIRTMRIEIAKAVSAKTITPAEGNALNTALKERAEQAARAA